MSPSSDPAAVEAAAPGPAGDDDRVVEVPVELPADLHARPAGRVVRVAAGLDAAVEIRYGDRSASGRSVLALMALGAVAGTTVVVRASGSAAATAAAEVAAVLAAAD